MDMGIIMGMDMEAARKQKREEKVEHKQVGIISINLHPWRPNVGCLLHSYAFQTYLAKYKVSSIILDYHPYYIRNYHLKYPILDYCSSFDFKRWIVEILRFFPHLINYNKCHRFADEHYIKTKRTYTQSELLDGQLQECEVGTWVCVTDAIWEFKPMNDKDPTKGFDPIFFLNFPAARNKRKVAYVPSMSAGTCRRLSPEDKAYFKTLISSFSAISLRERIASEMVSELIHKPVDWLLDPTLLLEASEYEKLVKPPKVRGYVLLYMVYDNNRRMINEAKMYAAQHGLRLIEISHFPQNCLKCSHTVKYVTGVEEWLGYVKYADCIFTNSFHGGCFSIIFQKQFWLFEREPQIDKFSHLMTVMGIQNHLVKPENCQPLSMDKIDYQMVNERLKTYRLRSQQFIEEQIIRYAQP
jgi:hypothetical protein